jgi:exopolyphosphatase/guanosine-5'-triphosphate,3'-diphosphate pyrophosphatase
MRFAVFDLGSTTFQLLVTDGDEDGTLTPILRDRVILNLGMVLSAADGRIPPSAGARAVDTVRRFRDVALRAGAERFLPIATSALRDAGNREELAAVLGEAAGDPIRFIDGRERPGWSSPGSVRAAIGAGPTRCCSTSVEPEVAAERMACAGASRLLSARAPDRTGAPDDPPERRERREIRRLVEEAIAPLVERAERGRARALCRERRTTGALAHLGGAMGIPPPSLNQWSIGLDEVRKLGRELSALDLDGRLKIDGVDERRADLLPAGVVVVTTAVAAFGLPSMLVSEFGLREGAVLDALGLGAGPGPTPAELRRRSWNASRTCGARTRRTCRSSPGWRPGSSTPRARPTGSARSSGSCSRTPRSCTTSAYGSAPTGITSTAPTWWSTRI